MIERMFETASPDILVGEIEECQRGEAILISRRMTAIATLLWHRTGEAEDASSDDPGYALITGFTRTCAEVSAAMNMSVMAANKMVGQAEALDTRLPEVARLLAVGKTDWHTVALIITRTQLVHDALMPELDHSMAERIINWQCWSRRRIINAVDAAVQVIDPEAAKERRATADNARHISVTTEPNGMARVHGAMTAPAAAIVDKRLSEMATSVCAHDTRTMDQRRADALLALSEGQALTCNCNRADCPARMIGESPELPRFVINVIASQETVDGSSDQPGYLEGYGVIDADQVRQLAESATLRILSEPAVSDAEALRYQPSAALERWIRCRDLTCRFPGCDRAAWFADIDHTIPFNHIRPSAGGLTVPSNNKCYCRHHHRVKTFHDGLDGWRDEQLPDGTVVLTSPTGRVYRNTPAGAELFPQMRGPCAEPVPRRHNRRREKLARTALARRKLNALRAPNAETRRINRGRYLEVDLRMWRNNMRKTLLVLKGGHPSTSPWCTWVNEPLEDVNITADWVPPPPPPRTPGGDKPPF
jgi:hypothetical protein